MSLEQSCLNAAKVQKTCFNLSVGSMNLMQPCLNVMKDAESTLHHCCSSNQIARHHHLMHIPCSTSYLQALDQTLELLQVSCISNQSMPAFVQSYSQSRARLMFVTTLGMGNFDCTKMNAHFKFTACLQKGLIQEWKQALLAPPLPLFC